MIITKFINTKYLTEQYLSVANYQCGYSELAKYGQALEDIKAAMWYPTASKSGTRAVYLNYLRGKAFVEVEMTAGAKPLILISHGAGGNCYNQYYLAEALAHYGYMVIAINHGSINAGPTENLTQLLLWPQLISEVLNKVLDESTLQEHINPKQIGMIGFSAGGYAAICLAGAKPNFNYDKSFRPFVTLKNNLTSVSMWDKRIKAMALLAPGLSQLFSPSELRKINIPISLFTSGQDEVIADSSKHYLVNITKIVKHIEFINAGHNIYNMPCPKLFEKMFVALCKDNGIERTKVHPYLIAETITFFNKYLVGG